VVGEKAKLSEKPGVITTTDRMPKTIEIEPERTSEVIHHQLYFHRKEPSPAHPARQQKSRG
jgi:hypothetical protein